MEYGHANSDKEYTDGWTKWFMEARVFFIEKVTSCSRPKTSLSMMSRWWKLLGAVETEPVCVNHPEGRIYGLKRGVLNIVSYGVPRASQ